MQASLRQKTMAICHGRTLDFEHLVSFYSHKNRSKPEIKEDEKLGLKRSGRVIFSNLFDCSVRLLSNTINGYTVLLHKSLESHVFPSTENIFQAAKCTDLADARFIAEYLNGNGSASYGQGRMTLTDAQKATLMELGVAEDGFVRFGAGWKRQGKDCPIGRFPLRKDWEECKTHVMLAALRAKFTSGGPCEADIKSLIPQNILYLEHTTNDRVWADAGDGSGTNFLGKLLVHLIEEVRAGQEIAIDEKWLSERAGVMCNYK